MRLLQSAHNCLSKLSNMKSAQQYSLPGVSSFFRDGTYQSAISARRQFLASGLERKHASGELPLSANVAGGEARPVWDASPPAGNHCLICAVGYFCVLRVACRHATHNTQHADKHPD